jgi:ribosomal protein L29
MFETYGSLGSAYGGSAAPVGAAAGFGAPYGLSKNPARARKKCYEAQAKLTALRAKRRAKGKDDNRAIRNLEAQVAKLCTWANEVERMSNADAAGFEGEVDQVDAALAQFLATEDVSSGPMQYAPGPTLPPLPGVGGVGGGGMSLGTIAAVGLVGLVVVGGIALLARGR